VEWKSDRFWRNTTGRGLRGSCRILLDFETPLRISLTIPDGPSFIFKVQQSGKNHRKLLLVIEDLNDSICEYIRNDRLIQTLDD